MSAYFRHTCRCPPLMPRSRLVCTPLHGLQTGRIWFFGLYSRSRCQTAFTFPRHLVRHHHLDSEWVASAPHWWFDLIWFILRSCQHDDGYIDGRSQIKVYTDERFTAPTLPWWSPIQVGLYTNRGRHTCLNWASHATVAAVSQTKA